MNYICFIILFCMTLTLQNCSFKYPETNDFVDFAKLIIENPNHLEDIILNSKYTNNKSDIEINCFPKYLRPNLDSCRINGYKIIKVSEEIFTDLKKNQIPMVFIIVKSNDITIEFSFAQSSIWLLDRIDRTGIGSDIR